ncbi:MAG: hypothetical protein H6699_02980 [Myxococcales bacterium]|nr:hypothetical protein [Myxococcales bacterium]
MGTSAFLSDDESWALLVRAKNPNLLDGRPTLTWLDELARAVDGVRRFSLLSDIGHRLYCGPRDSASFVDQAWKALHGGLPGEVPCRDLAPALTLLDALTPMRGAETDSAFPPSGMSLLVWATHGSGSPGLGPSAPGIEHLVGRRTSGDTDLLIAVPLREPEAARLDEMDAWVHLRNAELHTSSAIAVEQTDTPDSPPESQTGLQTKFVRLSVELVTRSGRLPAALAKQLQSEVRVETEEYWQLGARDRQIVLPEISYSAAVQLSDLLLSDADVLTARCTPSRRVRADRNLPPTQGRSRSLYYGPNVVHGIGRRSWAAAAAAAAADALGRLRRVATNPFSDVRVELEPGVAAEVGFRISAQNELLIHVPMGTGYRSGNAPDFELIVGHECVRALTRHVAEKLATMDEVPSPLQTLLRDTHDVKRLSIGAARTADRLHRGATAEPLKTGDDLVAAWLEGWVTGRNPQDVLREILSQTDPGVREQGLRLLGLGAGARGLKSATGDSENPWLLIESISRAWFNVAVSAVREWRAKSANSLLDPEWYIWTAALVLMVPEALGDVACNDREGDRASTKGHRFAFGEFVEAVQRFVGHQEPGAEWTPSTRDVTDFDRLLSLVAPVNQPDAECKGRPDPIVDAELRIQGYELLAVGPGGGYATLKGTFVEERDAALRTRLRWIDEISSEFQRTYGVSLRALFELQLEVLALKWITRWMKSQPTELEVPTAGANRFASFNLSAIWFGSGTEPIAVHLGVRQATAALQDALRELGYRPTCEIVEGPFDGLSSAPNKGAGEIDVKCRDRLGLTDTELALDDLFGPGSDDRRTADAFAALGPSIAKLKVDGDVVRRWASHKTRSRRSTDAERAPASDLGNHAETIGATIGMLAEHAGSWFDDATKRIGGATIVAEGAGHVHDLLLGVAHDAGADRPEARAGKLLLAVLAGADAGFGRRTGATLLFQMPIRNLNSLREAGCAAPAA